MNKVIIRALADVTVSQYRKTSNPLLFWNLINQIRYVHFWKRGEKVDDRFFREVFSDLPPEALAYLLRCAVNIGNLMREPNATVAQKRVAQALGIVDGKRNRFRELKAEVSASRLAHKDAAARKSGLRGAKRKGQALAGELATDDRTLARKLARARARRMEEDEAWQRALGISGNWPGIGGKK